MKLNYIDEKTDFEILEPEICKDFTIDVASDKLRFKCSQRTYLLLVCMCLYNVLNYALKYVLYVDLGLIVVIYLLLAFLFLTSLFHDFVRHIALKKRVKEDKNYIIKIDTKHNEVSFLYNGRLLEKIKQQEIIRFNKIKKYRFTEIYVVYIKDGEECSLLIMDHEHASIRLFRFLVEWLKFKEDSYFSKDRISKFFYKKKEKSFDEKIKRFLVIIILIVAIFCLTS